MLNQSIESLEQQNMANETALTTSSKEGESLALEVAQQKDQVNKLISLGLTTKQIKALKYEEDRVKKIIELENKKKVKN